MKPILNSMKNILRFDLKSIWTRRSSTLLLLGIGLSLLSVALRFFPEMYRLLLSTEVKGAVDLILRHGEVQRWFAGLPVYTSRSHSGYPPASYVMLFPLLGLLDAQATRWLWAAITLVELSCLAIWTIRFTGTTARLEKVLIVLTFFSAYPITVTLGNGQLGIHMLMMFLCGMLLLYRGTDWRTDCAAAIFLLLASTKPSFSAPLYWTVLFAVGRLRPIVLAGCGYVLLTGLALAFQPEPILQIFSDFIRCNAAVIHNDGAAHIAAWLHWLGLSEWTAAVSLAMFLALGVWVFRNRRTNVCLLLGVSAIVARLWTYHRMYDDLLVLIPMIALLRLLREYSLTGNQKVVAGCLLGTSWLAMHMPASTPNYQFPWNLPYEIGWPVIWGAMLVLLAYVIWKHTPIARAQH
jgi:hypothetical protein